MIVIKPWNQKKFKLNREKYPIKNIYNFDKTLNLSTSFDDTKSPDFIHDLRKAAEYHKAVRKYIQTFLKPEMKIYDISNLIENKIIELTQVNDLTAGIAFPTGVSLNNIIAHDTANPNDNRIFGYNDICKIDYGVHVNGYIIDCAFSATFNPKYEPLLLATKEATWGGIKLAGPDALCNEISAEIKEIIESHEIELDGKNYAIKAVNDLGGHSIDQYNIHSGLLLLCAPCNLPQYANMRMPVNSSFAIETFASTGTGKYKQGEIINHFMLNKDVDKINYNFKTTKSIHQWITKNRGTLPFTQRWISKDPIIGSKDPIIGSKYRLGLKELLDKKIVIGYPPLYDISGSYTSHMEHTIYIHEYGKEVLSAGDDY